ncbi:MAG: transcriptional regulator [Desulfurococcaceae archaeon TW002]
MSSVFELGYRYLIPSLKRRLTEIMNKELRMSEVEIARELKITPSSVSRYLRGERGAAIEIATYTDINEELIKLAKDLSKQDLDLQTIEIRLLKITIQVMSKNTYAGSTTNYNHQ